MNLCRIASRLFSSQGQLANLTRFSEKVSKARPVMSLYQLLPLMEGDVFIAPNATIVGDVWLGNKISIWHGTVIRGDINSVMIHNDVSIGNNCVLHTAASAPGRTDAGLIIWGFGVIQANCTLYSCEIKEGAFIGANSVILEGAVVQQGAIVAPNSVVPPGRVVPAMQVWGGNPIKYIRPTLEQEAWVIQESGTAQHSIGAQYRTQFSPYSNAYLYRKSSEEDQKQIDSGRYVNHMNLIAQRRYNPDISTIV